MAAVKRSLNVGVLGMGRMGVPIARNIAFKSRTAMYLQLHSRTLSRAKKVADDLQIDGAQCAMRLHNKYSTMSKWCDVILCVLSHATASRYVMLEAPDALLKNAREGQIIVDHTTIDKETALEYELHAQQKGAIFIDAPMSGSPQSALNGQLTLMVGGHVEPYLKLLPLFRLYADTIHRLGNVGSGVTTKGILSILIANHAIAAAEALQMAHQCGIEDSDTLLKVLDSSWGSSTILRRNASATERLLRNPDQPPPVSSATINSLLTDIGMISQGALFDSPNVPTASLYKDSSHFNQYPSSHQAANILAQASHAGIGDRDISGVVHFLGSAQIKSSPLPQENHIEEDSSKINDVDLPPNKMLADTSEEMEFY